MMTVRLALLVTAFAMAQPAQAALTLRASASSDAAFEFTGGILDQAYSGLVPVGNNVLIPLERAVGQVRSGQTDRRALYLPTSATGRPVADGGSGVTNALTNVSPWASATTNFANGTPVAFSMARVGNVVTYTVGGDVFTSDARASLGNANAFVIRIRSQSGSSNAIGINDLIFSDGITAGQALAPISAADGAVAIRLLDGIRGDFRLAGSYQWTWSGTRPGGSALASQIKLIEVPGAVPEPASWAMLITGFGLVGGTLRCQRRAKPRRRAA